MLDNLKDGLRSAIKKIVSSSGIDEELIKELLKIAPKILKFSQPVWKKIAEYQKLNKKILDKLCQVIL